MNAKPLETPLQSGHDAQPDVKTESALEKVPAKNNVQKKPVKSVKIAGYTAFKIHANKAIP